MSNLVEFVDGDMTEEDRKKIDELLIKIDEENKLPEKTGKLEEENARLREALEEIKNNVKEAQDPVYSFHFDLDSKHGAFILEIAEKALTTPKIVVSPKNK